MLAQLDRLPTSRGPRAGRGPHVRRRCWRTSSRSSCRGEGPDRVHPWQSYVLAVHPARTGRRRARAAGPGIGCTIGTYASHLQPVYGPQKPLPVSADLFARHLAIPMHANLTAEEVTRVADAVREVVALPDVRA